MAEKIIAGLFLLVGIVNVLPVVAFFDPSKTVRLYGVPVEGESLTILMRHRGVLLALVGAVLIFAAFKPEFRLFAVGLALASKLAFIFLTFGSAGPTPEIRQVALIDVGAIVVLLAISIYQWLAK